jgi:hypothetical protein
VLCDAVSCWQTQESDSAGQKLGGALLNAIIFMAVIGGMTFLLFLLFKWGVRAGAVRPVSWNQRQMLDEHAVTLVVAPTTGLTVVVFKA